MHRIEHRYVLVFLLLNLSVVVTPLASTPELDSLRLELFALNQDSRLAGDLLMKLEEEVIDTLANILSVNKDELSEDFKNKLYDKNGVRRNISNITLTPFLS